MGGRMNRRIGGKPGCGVLLALCLLAGALPSEAQEMGRPGMGPPGMMGPPPGGQGAGNAGEEAFAVNVQATIKPLHSLAEAVIGDRGKVRLLIAGNGSPYAASQSRGPGAVGGADRRAPGGRSGSAADGANGKPPNGATKEPPPDGTTAPAKLFLWIGPELEASMADMVAALPPEQVLTVMNMDLPTKLAKRTWEKPQQTGPSDPDALDPQVWLDPENGVAIAFAIADRLSQLDPDGADSYRSNAEAYAERIRGVPLSTAEASADGRGYIAFNDAFQYAEHARNLSAPLGVLMDPPGTAPSAARREELAAAMAGQQVICVFGEPQFTALSAAMLGRKVGASVRLVDPLGSDLLPGPDLYVALLEEVDGLMRDCSGAL